VTEPNGQPATNAVVVLRQEGREIRRVTAAASGDYSFVVPQPDGLSYDLSITREDGATAGRSGLVLQSGERQ